MDASIPDILERSGQAGRILCTSTSPHAPLGVIKPTRLKSLITPFWLGLGAALGTIRPKLPCAWTARCGSLAAELQKPNSISFSHVQG